MTAVFQPLKAPYPYFGGKSKVASLVWERFGDTPNYCEPFFGSGAVLLARPHEPKTETINDLNCFVANFWRALQAEPEAVAKWADWPVNETDLHPRHRWLVNEGAQIIAACKDNPEFYDAKIAGWWVWGASQWIGSGWCSPLAVKEDGSTSARICQMADAGMGVHRTSQQIPDLQNAGQGVHRTVQKMPLLTNDGVGVNRVSFSKPSEQLPHLGDAGRGLHRPHQKMPELGSERGTRSERASNLHAYLQALSDRLRRVRVCCGNWSRILGPTPTTKHGMTAVFLDPPYALGMREAVYAHETDCAADVRSWCMENGSNPLLRIAYCSYGETPVLPGWERVHWKAAGGYGSQGKGRGRENALRETIDFSPHCLKPSLDLFSLAEHQEHQGTSSDV